MICIFYDLYYNLHHIVMGNFFTKKNSNFDSVILDELNRPLVPDVQHTIFTRLTALEKIQSEHIRRLEGIDDTLKALNENIGQRNIIFNNDIYKTKESLHNICMDMDKLVKNDQILKRDIDKFKQQIDEIDKKSTIQGLYASESAM